MEERLKVLVVEDIPIYVSLLKHMLTSSEINVVVEGTLNAGLRAASQGGIDTILLDLGLPDSQGLNTFTEFYLKYPNIPIVILSGLDDEDLASEAVIKGAQDYLVKGPYLTKGEAGKNLLTRAIRYAIERQRAQEALRNEHDTLEKRVAERTLELLEANKQLELELLEGERIGKALRESEANNQALLSAMPDLICRIDNQGIILDFKVPPSFAKIIPLPEKLIGVHFSELLSPIDVWSNWDFPQGLGKQGQEVYQLALQSGKPQIFEAEIRVDGQRLNFEFRMVITLDKDIMVLIRDVTESKALERMWRRYEFIANTSKELLALVDGDYRYQAVNDAYCLSHDKPRQAILGRTVSQVWGSTVFQSEIKPHIDLCFDGVENVLEGWLEYGALGLRFFEIVYYPYYNPEKQITHVVIVARDETSRKQAEDKLHRYYERLDILREIDRATLKVQSPEAIARVALRNFHRLVPYNQADILMFSQDIVRTTTLFAQEPPEVTVLAGRTSERTMQRGERFSKMEIPNIEQLEKGSHYQVSDLLDRESKTGFEEKLLQRGNRSYVMVPLVVEGDLIGAINLASEGPNEFHDEYIRVTHEMGRQLALMLHNAKLFEQIRSGRERLRYLTGQLVSAQEDERRRISLELHDEAGQALTALKLGLVLMQSSLENGNQEVRKQMEDAISLTETTMEQIRSLAHNLRPPALDALGLSQTMGDHCKRIYRQTGIKVDYQGLDLPNLPSHYQVNLYRILQEALTNVIKHARADQVVVELGYDSGKVILQIEDNGVGFDFQMVSSQLDNQGIGLLGIGERLEALGGNFEVRTQPGKGTTLLASVPWEDEV